MYTHNITFTQLVNSFENMLGKRRIASFAQKYLFRVNTFKAGTFGTTKVQDKKEQVFDDNVNYEKSNSVCQSGNGSNILNSEKRNNDRTIVASILRLSNATAKIVDLTKYNTAQGKWQGLEKTMETLSGVVEVKWSAYAARYRSFEDQFSDLIVHVAYYSGIFVMIMVIITVALVLLVMVTLFLGWWINFVVGKIVGI
jgi:hypothetical protein